MDTLTNTLKFIEEFEESYVKPMEDQVIKLTAKKPLTEKEDHKLDTLTDKAIFIRQLAVNIRALIEEASLERQDIKNFIRDIDKSGMRKNNTFRDKLINEQIEILNKFYDTNIQRKEV